MSKLLTGCPNLGHTTQCIVWLKERLDILSFGRVYSTYPVLLSYGLPETKIVNIDKLHTTKFVKYFRANLREVYLYKRFLLDGA